MRLFVDDLRPAPEGWRLARTVEEAVALLANEAVEELSLDYMIGHIPGATFAPVARFVAALPSERRPRRVRLHTSSEHGAWELRSILEGFVDEIVRA